jgi:hypothetical protein
VNHIWNTIAQQPTWQRHLTPLLQRKLNSQLGLSPTISAGSPLSLKLISHLHTLNTSLSSFYHKKKIVCTPSCADLFKMTTSDWSCAPTFELHFSCERDRQPTFIFDVATDVFYIYRLSSDRSSLRSYIYIKTWRLTQYLLSHKHLIYK